jgi:anti-sigma factor ChrR (cupin superfamily)
MSVFAKQLGCPSSATLSAYGSGTLSFLARLSVAEHLAACDFCGAELSLLRTQHAHAVGVDEMPETHVNVAAAPPMPLALRLLAESLFGEMHNAPHAAERRAA